MILNVCFKLKSMLFTRVSLLLIFIPLFSIHTIAQDGYFEIRGRITEASGLSIPLANVFIDSLNLGAISDIDGYYVLKNVPKGAHTISVRYLGYITLNSQVTISDKNITANDFVLEEDVQSLTETTISGKTKAQQVQESGFNVNVIELKNVQEREVTLNQLMTQTAGIRVRESGGLGSNSNYSLDGMAGRSVRFFIDGIPLDRFGSAYGINNFPVNLIDRVEIYKGVVPPQFGSDALGGVINLVTKSKKQKYLDVSYSFGSFNTHRGAVSGRWVHDASNFYVDVQAFHNYSKNNYWVWGNGVEVADPNTGRSVSIKTRRFHDAYRSTSGKIGIGFFDKKWADQVNISFVGAGNFKEIQHGTTMASVYGEATRKDIAYAPSLFYTKKRLFGTGLDLTLYSSVSLLESSIVDTSSRVYDWSGKVVSEHPQNSEIGRGNNGKSLLTLNSDNWFQQINLAYVFNENHKILANYTFDLTKRDGEDPKIGSRTASYIVPQSLRKQITSLAYEFITWKKLEHSVWVKNYDFKVNTVYETYITDSLGYRPIANKISAKNNNFGFGYALKYNIRENYILKFSAEKSYRLPDAEEILGDGLFVRTNSNLKPEESINLNLGTLIKNIRLGNDKNKMDVEASGFFRNADNQILYLLQGTLGSGRYENVSKVRTYGVTLDARYTYNNKLRVKGNVTYQQPKDWNESTSTGKNITYKDLLPNTPYLMANGECSYTHKDLFFDKTEMVVYWETQYVHEFYLNWPSLGSKNKAFIPTQLVNNVGLSYSLMSGKYSLSATVQNIFNEQVYDNYLLQKPGRAFSIKARVLI